MSECEARPVAFTREMQCRRCAMTWSKDGDPVLCGKERDGPLNRQEGGTHYKALVIQPVEFMLKNSWDFAAGSSLKYLTRWRAKNGVEDLKKARHFVELRQQFVPYLPITPPAIIPMNRYIVENGIPVSDAPALLALELLVHTPSDALERTASGLTPVAAANAELACRLIGDLIDAAQNGAIALP